MAKTPEPTFTVQQSEKPFEIRSYDPMIIAEVSVSGDREKAINDGFRLLADYIFGNNLAKDKIEMTAPVTQSARGENIPMTAPVTQEKSEAGDWVVAFIMPPGSTMDTLPKPVNPSIRMIERKPYKAAVIRFSGFASDSVLKAKQAELEGWMKSAGLKAKGEAVYAFYNPPWTLPFLRRNEVIFALEE